MHLATLLSLPLAFISLTSARAIPLARSRNSPALTWHVSDFDTGCSPGGCTYKFHILGVETPNTPGFDTVCQGTDEQDGYKACDDKHVSAKLNPKTYPEWNVQVKHAWAHGSAEYSALGQANISVPIQQFKINVTEEYGVA